MQWILCYANIVHTDVYINSRTPLWPVGDIHRLSYTRIKKDATQFLPSKGNHVKFIVCLPTIDKEAPEIANIMQREHNRFSGSQVNISHNADCFSSYLLIVAFMI